MRKLLVIMVMLLSTACLADSFEIDGFLYSPVTGNGITNFLGTIDINPTTGSVLSWSLTMPSIPAGFGEPGITAFTFTPSMSHVFVSSMELDLVSSDQRHSLYLVFPTNGLVGLTEASFGGGYGDPRSRNGAFYQVSGTIASTVAPEPSSLFLMISGVVGMFISRHKPFGRTP